MTAVETTRQPFRLWMLGKGWVTITTAAKLHALLSQCVTRLDEIGQSGIAENWRSRLAFMPAHMDKESINFVLLSAYCELERNGTLD